MNSFIKKYKIELIIFISALILRTVLFFINFSVNNYDLITTIKADDGYYELSQNIINGHGFTFDSDQPYRPNSLRPPLWPYLIALFAFMGGYWLVLVVEIFMASLIPVFGYKIAKLLFEEKIARVVSILMVIEPYSVLLSFLLYSETSFTFFFIVSLYFLIKNFYKENILYMIWSGIFLGLSLLIKPTVQYFPILIPLFFVLVFWKNNLKNRLIQAIIYSVIAVAIISPWLIRNYRYFGKMEMTVQPAFNLYVYLVPTLLSIDNKTSFATEIDNFVYKKGVNVFDITLANQAKYKSEALPIIFDHKLALIESVLMTLVTFFTHDGMLTVLQYSGIRIINVVNEPFIQLLFSPLSLFKIIYHYLFSPAILIMIGRLLWFILTIFMFYGVFDLYRKRKLNAKYILMSLIILYFALTTSINGLGVNARFRVPILVLIFSFAVYGFYAILAFIKIKYYEKNIDSNSGL